MRKRISRRVSFLTRKNDKLNDEQVKSLQRIVWRLQKQNTWTSKARNKPSREAAPDAAPDVPSQDVATPDKEADSEMRREGISPRRATKLRRTLILHNSIVKHLKGQKVFEPKKAVSSVSRTNSSRLFAGPLNISRKRPQKNAETRRKVKVVIQKRSIESFFLISANPTCLPRKKDVMKVGKEKMQKYICNDNIALLHKKYILSTCPIKLATGPSSGNVPKMSCQSSLAKGVSVNARYIKTSTFVAPFKPFAVPQSAIHFLELYQNKESLESELPKLTNEDVQF